MVHQSNATHVAPLGLGVIWLTVYYKHAAPLGLNEVKRNGTQICVPYELRSSGALGLTLPRFYRHIAPLERKAGSGFFSIYGASIQCDTCRPAGAWGHLADRVL